VHGGLSPEIKTLDQIRTIDRGREIPHEGAFCDLVWSDPEETVDAWATSPRGAGWLFGSKVAEHFLQINALTLLCRAHQLVNEGKNELMKTRYNQQKLGGGGMQIPGIVQ
jgi:diadenosine tetraphosphatase ApaH/serine/threonine PP2A family protein phosphatase